MEQNVLWILVYYNGHHWKGVQIVYTHLRQKLLQLVIFAMINKMILLWKISLAYQSLCSASRMYITSLQTLIDNLQHLLFFDKTRLVEFHLQCNKETTISGFTRRINARAMTLNHCLPLPMTIMAKRSPQTDNTKHRCLMLLSELTSLSHFYSFKIIRSLTLLLFTSLFYL